MTGINYLLPNGSQTQHTAVSGAHAILTPPPSFPLLLTMCLLPTGLNRGFSLAGVLIAHTIIFKILVGGWGGRGGGKVNLKSFIRESDALGRFCPFQPFHGADIPRQPRPLSGSQHLVSTGSTGLKQKTTRWVLFGQHKSQLVTSSAMAFTGRKGANAFGERRVSSSVWLLMPDGGLERPGNCCQGELSPLVFPRVLLSRLTIKMT